MSNTSTNTPNTAATEATPTSTTTHTSRPHRSKHQEALEQTQENRWVARLEELLKVKNVEELKTELSKLASEIQTEIQNFDINTHLSPEAKTRLKTLEQRYAEIIRMIQKAQKQFDREFNKSLRILKRTRQDAQKHIKNIQVRITKHRGTILKASNKLKKKLTGTKVRRKATKTVRRATPSAKAQH